MDIYLEVEQEYHVLNMISIRLNVSRLFNCVKLIWTTEHLLIISTYQ